MCSSDLFPSHDSGDEYEESMRLRNELDILRRKVEGMQSDVDYAKTIGNGVNTVLVRDIAKILTQNGTNVGGNTLMQMMRDDGFLVKSGPHKNTPTQRAVESGLLRLSEAPVQHNTTGLKIGKTPRVTMRGQRFFISYYTNALSS